MSPDAEIQKFPSAYRTHNKLQHHEQKHTFPNGKKEKGFGLCKILSRGFCHIRISSHIGLSASTKVETHVLPIAHVTAKIPSSSEAHAKEQGNWKMSKGS